MNELRTQSPATHASGISAMSERHVIVVGGGAAGLMAAGRAAQTGATTRLLEKMAHPGRKLAITGKGRCNLTNVAELPKFIEHFGKTGKFLHHAFSRFFSEDLIAFFESQGLEPGDRAGRARFSRLRQSAGGCSCARALGQGLGRRSQAFLPGGRIHDRERTNSGRCFARPGAGLRRRDPGHGRGHPTPRPDRPATATGWPRPPATRWPRSVRRSCRWRPQAMPRVRWPGWNCATWASGC